MASVPCNLIEVTLDPPELQRVASELMDRTHGHHCTKHSANGKSTTKSFFIDRMSTRVFYTPSNKNFADSSFLFNAISMVSTNPEDAALAKAADGSQCPHTLVIRTRNLRSITLSFPNAVVRDEFAQFVAFQVRKAQDGIPEDPYKARLYDLWMAADTNGDNNLVFEELRGLLRGLNINMEDKMIRKQFAKYDDNNSGALCFKEFAQLYQGITKVEALEPFFNRYADGELMTADGIKRFFKDAYNETLTDDMADKMIRAYSSSSSVPGISSREFSTFLLDPVENSFYNPSTTRKVHQDMSRPLNEYYIASSHNTYLSGDQLASRSDPAMYSQALLAGCRCVELDCWDGPGDDPIVYHGYTRTSKIKFSDVIKAINNSAFEKSDYPVILSLEVHTSSVQCGVMARILRTVLADKLYTAADHAKNEFTSPEQLKGKILCKWKGSASDPEDVKDTEGAEEIETNKSASPRPTEEKPSSSKYSKTGKEDLMRLVTVPAKHYDDWGASAMFNHITSYAEGKVDTYFKKERENFTNCNMKMLSRTYPGGSRINSSNYSPLNAWEMGAQVVALNYQTWDAPLRLNDAKYRQNGRCGYVLKPEYLRDSAVAAPTDTYKLRVTIVLGSQLPKPDGEDERSEIIDPYVTLTLSGSAEDTEANKTSSTKVIDDNGFNPIWNESFEFTITNLDLAFLTVRVLDKDTLSADDEIGESSVPINHLRLGYRAIPLYSTKKGELLQNASILGFFEMEKI